MAAMWPSLHTLIPTPRLLLNLLDNKEIYTHPPPPSFLDEAISQVKYCLQEHFAGFLCAPESPPHGLVAPGYPTAVSRDRDVNYAFRTNQLLYPFRSSEG
jgi:hypothetical protein